jgi:preprotein translocase subunit SecA
LAIFIEIAPYLNEQVIHKNSYLSYNYFMSGFLSKILGGNKSEKDVKKIAPIVTKSNDFFTQYTSISNDALRAKSQDFKQRIKDYLTEIDAEIEQKKQAAEALPETEISQRDFIYKEVDELKKGRDKKIEEILSKYSPKLLP